MRSWPKSSWHSSNRTLRGADSWSVSWLLCMLRVLVLRIQISVVGQAIAAQAFDLLCKYDAAVSGELIHLFSMFSIWYPPSSNTWTWVVNCEVNGADEPNCIFSFLIVLYPLPAVIRLSRGYTLNSAAELRGQNWVRSKSEPDRLRSATQNFLIVPLKSDHRLGTAYLEPSWRLFLSSIIHLKQLCAVSSFWGFLDQGMSRVNLRRDPHTPGLDVDSHHTLPILQANWQIPWS